MRRRIFAVVVTAGVFSAVHAHSQTRERFEVSAFKSLRPSLSKLDATLHKGDIAGAKAAFGEVDADWKGIEGYLSTRDQSAYKLENGLRAAILVGLNKPKPDAGALAADARMLLADYDRTIAMVAKAPPLDPLFDDVARLRIFRAALRNVDIALRIPDFPKARQEFTAFTGKLDSVKGILKARSPEALDGITKGIAQLQSELNAPKPNATKSMSFIGAMNVKYNLVLAQVTKEARAKQGLPDK